MVETDPCESGHYEAAVGKHIMAEQLFGEGVVLVGIGHRVVHFEQGLRLTHPFRQFLGRALSRVNDKFLHNVLVFFIL